MKFLGILIFIFLISKMSIFENQYLKCQETFSLNTCHQIFHP